MGYCIVYGPEPKIAHPKKRSTAKLRIRICLFLLLLSFGIKALWPGGTAMLRRFLLPGESEITQQALDAMVRNLGSGIPISDALGAFCQQIIVHGRTSQ